VRYVHVRMFIFTSLCVCVHTHVYCITGKIPGNVQNQWTNKGPDVREAPGGKLPPDWEEIFSKSTGKNYYYNRCEFLSMRACMHVSACACVCVCMCVSIRKKYRGGNSSLQHVRLCRYTCMRTNAYVHTRIQLQVNPSVHTCVQL
jgi:hypothetical protein